MKKTIKCLFIFIFFSVIPEKNLHAQFLEPGVGVGLVSYSGDLQRGYSIRSAALGFELFQRLNLSKHISVKGGIKKGTIKGEINPSLDFGLLHILLGNIYLENAYNNKQFSKKT